MTLRPESSVSAGIDEYGELVFACDRPGPVIHRTPEELGIERTVPDVPVRKTLSLTWTDGIASGSMRAAGVKRDHKQTMCTVASERALRAEEEIEMKKKVGGVKCAFEGCNEMAFDGRKYCAARHGYKNKPAMPKKKRDASLQTVQIDPQRPGTAAALINALSKLDADAERVKVEIELTRVEVAQMLDRLGPQQRDAFLSAGLRAALLV